MVYTTNYSNAKLKSRLTILLQVACLMLKFRKILATVHSFYILIIENNTTFNQENRDKIGVVINYLQNKNYNKNLTLVQCQVQSFYA